MSVSMSMSIALQAREPEVPPLRRRFRFGCGRDGNLHTGIIIIYQLLTMAITHFR